MGMFTGIGEAQVGVGRRYFVQGKFKVKVQEVTSGTTRKGMRFFAVESEVLESNADAFKPGDVASWFVKMDGNDSALGNIKGFLAAALDLPPAEVTEDDAELAVSQDQPLVGAELVVVANQVKTRAGRDFTAVNWYSLSASEAKSA